MRERASTRSQIFRIDHYLGKETVQNILVFRFGNSVFERVWNRDAIDHIQITVAETIGIEGRGDFYEEVGRPARHRAEPRAAGAVAADHGAAGVVRRGGDARREGEAAAARCARWTRRRTVRGQYARGRSMDGERVPGYREEQGVAPDSTTETFVACGVCDRQLALGRRAVLPAHRQAAAPPRHRDRDRVQATCRLPFFEASGVERAARRTT